MVAEEMPQISDGDRKTQPLTEDQFHVGHTHNFTLEIEQRAPAVARVDLGRGLNVRQTLEVAIPRADNPLRNGPLQAQRISDCEYLIPFVQVLVLRNKHRPELQIFLLGNLHQCQIEVGIQGDDFDVINPPAGEFALRVLVIDRRRDPRLFFDHVVIGDAEAPLIQNKPRAQPAGRLDQYHPFPELLSQILHTLVRQIGGLEQGFIVPLRDGDVGRFAENPVLDLRQWNADHIHPDVDDQFLGALLQHIPFDLLARLQFNYIRLSSRQGQTEHKQTTPATGNQFPARFHEELSVAR